MMFEVNASPLSLAMFKAVLEALLHHCVEHFRFHPVPNTRSDPTARTRLDRFADTRLMRFLAVALAKYVRFRGLAMSVHPRQEPAAAAGSQAFL
jgi:hypothetical protein